MDRQIEAFRADGDPRERFLLMYRTFKGRLRQGIRDGRFLDDRWAEAICCRMAGTYFEALEQYDADDPACPECWVRAFDLSLEGRTNFLQDALLGMNAHINYDLTLATRDTLTRFDDLAGDTDSDRPDQLHGHRLKRRHHDYLLINDFAWEAIPLIQDVLTERFSRLVGILNRLSFRVSRAFMERIIMEHRDRSWGHVLLLGSMEHEDRKRRFLRFMDLQASRHVRRIMSALSWNPVVVAREAVRGFPLGDLDPERPDVRSASRLLVEELADPRTAAHARRALEEYGAAAAPPLIDALERGDPSFGARRHMMEVLAESGTARAASSLVGQLGHDDSRVRALACTELLRMARDEALPRRLRSELRVRLGEELREAYRTRQQLDDLDSPDAPALLVEALEHRSARAVMRCFGLLALVADRPAAGPGREELLRPPSPYGLESPEPSPSRLRGRAREVREALEPLLEANRSGALEWHRRRMEIEALRTDERVRACIVEGDRWLKWCAVHSVLRGGRTELAEPVGRALGDDPELAEELAVRPEELDGPETVRELITGWSEGKETMKSTIEKTLHLKKVALFREIPAEELVDVARVSSPTGFRKGERLIREGGPGRALFVVLEGTVDVRKGGSRVARIEEGGVVGEMALVSDRETTADCVASTPVRTLRIGREDFRRLLLFGDHPEMALGLLDVLSERLEETTRKLEGA